MRVREEKWPNKLRDTTPSYLLFAKKQIKNDVIKLITVETRESRSTDLFTNLTYGQIVQQTTFFTEGLFLH